MQIQVFTFYKKGETLRFAGMEHRHTTWHICLMALWHVLYSGFLREIENGSSSAKSHQEFSEICRLPYLILTSLPSQTRKQPIKILSRRNTLDVIPPTSRSWVVISGRQALSKRLSLPGSPSQTPHFHSHLALREMDSCLS